MTRSSLNLALLAALALSIMPVPSAASRLPAPAHPVIDSDFPDPTVIRAQDGFYYAYGTQSERAGKMLNIQVARSPDLLHWRQLGDALPVKPVWAVRTQDFWAPHVQRAGARYILYYSAKPDAALADETSGLCLAVASSATPEGPFVDMGRPLLCGEGFVNIDPMAFDDPRTGKHWLYWGSGFKPIKVQELAADRMSFAPGSTARNLVWPNRSGVQGAFPVLVEGSWVHRHGGFYYLFYSGDNCCGAKANYAVMVARSRTAVGPFQSGMKADEPRRFVVQRDRRWLAPGHNSVVTDRNGNDWIAYHAVDTERTRTKPTEEINSRRVMLIRRIKWKNGWPTVG